MTAAVMVLAGCTGGGGNAGSSATTATATASPTTEAKVYDEDELRALISGMSDASGKELRLYSKEQVSQGGNIANLLMSTATVDPKDCKDIATAGLLDTVQNGKVAVAISEGDQPRTLSAQSGGEGPDAVAVLQQIGDKMDHCANFSVAALGQTYQVSSKELEANTDAQKTFATVSTRSGGDQTMLMQVSAADGRLLLVATKGGANLGDQDQKELEDLINKVLQKTRAGTGTSSTTTFGTTAASTTSSPNDSASPTSTESENNGTPSSTPSR